jgi:hypothetical protein
MVLNQPQQLRWKGTDAEWDPVEHADSYHVTIYTIEKDGRLTQRGKELTCSTTSINTREILYSKPGDYIFKVEAASDQTYLYTSKKQSWLIIIQNIYLLKISAIIQDTGRRKMVRNSINLLPPNALNMIANTL